MTLDAERKALAVIAGDPPTIGDSEKWEDALATLLALIERVERGIVMYECRRDATESGFTKTPIPGARKVRLIPEPDADGD